MGLLSFLHKNKQEAVQEDREYQSRAEEESNAIRNRDQPTPGKRTSTVREDIDPVLPEKKRARRRLVGAFALVLAAIVCVPMLLDSEPKPLAGDVAIQIPSRDKLEPSIASNDYAGEVGNVNTGVIGGASANAVAASANSVAVRPVASPPVNPIATGTPAPKVAIGQTLDASEEVVESLSKPISKPIVKPPTVATPAPAPTPTPTPATKPTATPTPAKIVTPAKPNPAPTLAATATPTATPTPQAKPVKPPVTEVVKPARVEKSDVAANDAEQKPAKAAANTDEADRAKAILEGRASEEPKPAKTGKFIVQVAALATQEKVDELQGRLRDAGLSSHAQKVTTASGERTRIRLGPFADKQEAERARAKLQALGLGGTLVPAP